MHSWPPTTRATQCRGSAHENPSEQSAGVGKNVSFFPDSTRIGQIFVPIRIHSWLIDPCPSTLPRFALPTRAFNRTFIALR
jgi:hypothetical protein